MGNHPTFAQPTVIVLYNGLKTTKDVPLTIEHMYTCGWAKTCSFWEQKSLWNASSSLKQV